MSLPEVVSREQWLAARTQLLDQEKQLTRRRDALNAGRRRLPMVEIDEDYAFEGPEGSAGLLDLFDGRRQLIVGHFMFDPAWEDGCPSCSAGADEVSQGLLDHLHARDTTLAYDFHVTLDERVTPAEYNYRPMPVEGDEPMEMPGTSYFLRAGERVFHTYSTYARGAGMTGGSYYWLDLTALGRQEDWEEPKGRAASAHAARPDFS